MAELIDKAQLAPRTQIELFEGGKILLTDESEDPFLPTFIELEAGPATLLFDFLLLHQDQLIRHRDAKQAEQPSIANITTSREKRSQAHRTAQRTQAGMRVRLR